MKTSFPDNMLRRKEEGKGVEIIAGSCSFTVKEGPTLKYLPAREESVVLPNQKKVVSKSSGVQL